VNNESLGTAVFLGAMGVGAFLWWLSRHDLRVGPLTIRLDEHDAGRLFLVTFAVVLADLAANYVRLANTGGWTPGDWRASQGFVALNVFIIVVVAPLIVVLALVSLFRRHRRKQ